MRIRLYACLGICTLAILSSGFDGKAKKGGEEKDKTATKESFLSDEERLKLKQLKIWHDLMVADQLSLWQTKHVFDLRSKTEAAASIVYRLKTLEELEQTIARDHKTSLQEVKVVFAKGLAEKWAEPKYPAFDEKKAAKNLDCTVYARLGGRMYHRAKCELLEGDDDDDEDIPVVSVTLYKALTTKGSRACATCKP
ncbi:hypothetical protein [Singulisphaera sp. PoT]|uniref:hypothetical protein n=1 Tax=Singulisphaera sp. PoT TaxID=3411797 RepID=UPI003BF58BAC